MVLHTNKTLELGGLLWISQAGGVVLPNLSTARAIRQTGLGRSSGPGELGSLSEMMKMTDHTKQVGPVSKPKQGVTIVVRWDRESETYRSQVGLYSPVARLVYLLVI
jgi:hypothetical protein